MKNTVYTLLLLSLVFSCKSKEEKETIALPEFNVSDDGQSVSFTHKESLKHFKTETAGIGEVTSEIIAPGKIAATVLSSAEGASQNVILFDNPELASNYTLLMQHHINIAQKMSLIDQKKAIVKQKEAIIKRKESEVERFNDLLANGVGTGKDLADAQTALLVAETELTLAEEDLNITQTELSNERAGIIEHEAKLKAGGFTPQILRSSAAGTAYVVCEIPENLISRISLGNTCIVQFSAFPEETFTGKIDAVTDKVDNITRMVKLRIKTDNPSGKLKTGMFSQVTVRVGTGNLLSVPVKALVTVQGKNYVFVKKSETGFTRRALQTAGQTGDRIVILSGVQSGEEVVTDGVMQLKGLSFGY
jgi:cobalt-zinc-cadmium efflux system membrane fusion protein